jgi:dTDP-4-amino-4,6-dideoxygalactose transaminase
MIKPISISLSPNVEKDDFLLALKTIFKPFKYLKGKSVVELEKSFSDYLGVKNTISFNSGRSSLYAILRALNFEKGSEVVLQAFTCNAASNPAIWAGLKPIYTNPNEDTFNIDVLDLEKKITNRTKAVIVQHTFGLPADLNEIKEICRKHNLVLIEDCAHSLGAEYEGEKVGTIGDVSFFSFSRDKIISSVYGGMVATKDDELAKKIIEFRNGISNPSFCWVLQQLLHPVLLWMILPFYGFFSLGKIKLVILQKLGILSKAVHWKEKRGMMPNYFPKRMPNALAILALNQFKKLEKFNSHRREIAKRYFEELKDSSFVLPVIPERRKHSFLRFVVKHPRAHEILKKSWKQNLLLGDWYTSAIAPFDTKIETVGYTKNSCIKAENLSEITLNLPTHINIQDKELNIIIKFLKEFK